MELRHIYNIATVLTEAFKTDELVGADIKDMTLQVKVTPQTLMRIDQEFYRQTHNMSLDGFQHSDDINAVIDGVHFLITGKKA